MVFHSVLILRDISERGSWCFDQIPHYRKCTWKQNELHFGNWILRNLEFYVKEIDMN